MISAKEDFQVSETPEMCMWPTWTWDVAYCDHGPKVRLVRVLTRGILPSEVNLKGITMTVVASKPEVAMIKVRRRNGDDTLRS